MFKVSGAKEMNYAAHKQEDHGKNEYPDNNPNRLEQISQEDVLVSNERQYIEYSRP